MTEIVDLTLDGKRYKVVFPDGAPPRAYVMTRHSSRYFKRVRGGPELYDRVVKAARRTLAIPATQNIPAEPPPSQPRASARGRA
jgi:hypothetical protein